MCFVKNKIQNEPLTITVTLIFVSVRSVSNYIRFKILDKNFEFHQEKYFLDCLTKN